MKRVQLVLLVCLAAVVLFLGAVLFVNAQSGTLAYLPVVIKMPTPTPTPSPTPVPTPTPPMVEFRGLWVTRFDWTLNASEINQAKIDEIVNNAASAGFNVIFFQVRGEADAFYASNYEPWSRRLTGTLGQDPGWDPLGYMVQQAHARGIQVHAYINVYPVWTDDSNVPGCQVPPDGTTPRHLYYLLRDYHGTISGKSNGLQWNISDQVPCSPYLRVSPASIFFDNHLMDVARDLVTRYDIDGLHLDHIRYDGANVSCDPVSEGRYGTNCFGYNGVETYADWQRRQVNGTVSKIYEQIVPLKPKLWLSAAVWPMYIDYWGWGGLEGYHDYYQDSKAWVGGGYIDSISPMIYGSSFWTQSRWQTLVQDFQNSGNGRFVIPGIGANFSDFAEIEARINMARQIGTAGHAIFSYSGLLANGYFDDLANGPYAIPATVPEITWHP
ncbi:MAG: glycoside hydrolase family 10 protein [Anaerolineae bacterium]